MELEQFFKEEGIEVFSEVSLNDLSYRDRLSVLEFFHAARSVIVFGKEVPVPTYQMPANEKTRRMLRIAESLDRTAVLLAGLLEAEQIPARAVPLYLPIRIVGGKVQGVVRLKHAAAAGGLGKIGKNTVLLAPRFGPRLLLSGVVTGRPVKERGEGDSAGKGSRNADDPLCSGCGRCIRVCPEQALGPNGVDAFRCRTVKAWVPPMLVPALKWMLRRDLLLKCMAPFAPWIASTATIRCSLCVTECPNFAGSGQSSSSLPDPSQRLSAMKEHTAQIPHGGERSIPL